jgi:hypothetical protein
MCLINLDIFKTNLHLRFITKDVHSQLLYKMLIQTLLIFNKLYQNFKFFFSSTVNLSLHFPVETNYTQRSTNTVYNF